MLITILIIVLIFALLGGPYTGWHQYGWGPSGILGVILVVILIMFLMDRI